MTQESDTPNSYSPNSLIRAGDPPPPADALKIAIIGCRSGRERFGRALTMLRDQFAVMALVDSELTAAKVWARQLGGRIAAYETPAALFQANTELQAVLISTPIVDTAATILEVAQHGIPILTSAPLAPTLAETDKLLAALPPQTQLLPIFPRRVSPDFLQVKELIDAGELGVIRQVRCDWSIPQESATGSIESEGSEIGWLELLFSLAGQSADVCRWWLGEAQTVSADIDLPAQLAEAGKREAPTIGNIIVAHARGQSTHHILRTRSKLPGQRYLLTGSGGQLELIISVGEKGGVLSLPVLISSRPGQRAIAQHPLPEVTEFLSPETARMRRLLEHFSAVAHSETAPQISLKDARASQEIVLAAIRSSQEDVKVSLPLKRF